MILFTTENITHTIRKKTARQLCRLKKKILVAKETNPPGVYGNLNRLQINKTPYLIATKLEFETLLMP